MKMIVFGGTSEGRILSEKLAASGHDVTVCVATATGAEALKGIPCRILTGRLNEKEMTETVKGFDMAADATHPYAEEASRNIRKACETAGIPLRRILRERSFTGDAVIKESIEEAAAYLAGTIGNILITTGSKDLESYRGIDPERLFPRVLPLREALDACGELGIPVKNIIAMHGPFSEELNEAVIRQYDIKYIVSKDGGAAGGFPEKLEAAERTGTVMILIGRPADEGISIEEFLGER